ncbi:CaiB/BaiF family protein [Ruegeria sp. TrichCH4B]|nr:CaiB/BaiF family protein [Ruegeria sp. TrichCH4B]
MPFRWLRSSSRWRVSVGSWSWPWSGSLSRRARKSLSLSYQARHPGFPFSGFCHTPITVIAMTVHTSITLRLVSRVSDWIAQILARPTASLCIGYTNPVFLSVEILILRSNNMAGPLVGMKVLDMSRILAGPWLGQILSDFGADVWKVERPKTGDDTRQWGPPFVQFDKHEGQDAAYFFAANRGKKSICLDLKDEHDLKILRSLAEKADILIENYKFGDLKRYGLDFDTLHKTNPGLVYCSITGFGHSGPYKEHAGYDMAIQAIGGIMSLTGEHKDRPGGGVQRVGVPIADLLTGTFAASAVIAAYHHKHLTGEGQHIDMSLLDTLVACLANQNMNYLASGTVPEPMGNEHPNISPYGVFPTSDGEFVLAVGNDRQYATFCRVSGLDTAATDSRFTTNSDRLRNREDLTALISKRTRQDSTTRWVELLNAAHVPCAPINSLDAVLSDPHVLARGMLINLPHGGRESVRLVANPVQFSGTKIEYTSGPPLLDEHREEILKMVRDELP